MGIRVPLVVVLLAVAPLFTPVASACVGAPAVPCGRIYPIILIQTEDKPGTLKDLARGAPLKVDATLTFTFDAARDGYSATMPNEPVTVSFEFPRKPQWAEIAVEPARIDVPVNDPTHFQPNPSDPANPQLVYVFQVPITITATLTGQAVLKDGLDYHKLLVFAKSTESGIFQSGYGIKEIRVVPEGAVHESDVAGRRDAYVATPLPAELALEGAARDFGGFTATLALPETTKWWQPTPVELRLDPAPAGRMLAAVHDEAGNLVAQSTLLDAKTGVAAFNVTFVRPGLHTATLTLLPDGGTSAPPMTFALDFVAGDLTPEGYQFPKTMLVTASDQVPRPNVNRGQDPRDALTQFERDIPFHAFETAQSVTVAVALKSLAPAAVPLASGGANLQFSVLDPEGKLLQTSSVDPANPAKAYRIGSVPAEGWYTLRINGAGLPAGGAYDAGVEVNYVQPPQARNLADGLADLTPSLLGSAGRNLTLPLDDLRVWEPGPFTPELEGVDAFVHAVTVTDENGTLVQATRARAGAATFTPPWPGVYRAFVMVEPPTPGTPFSPTVRAFTFSVGSAETVTAQTFAVEDAQQAPLAAGATLMGLYALPRGAPDVPVEGGDNVALKTAHEGDVMYLVATTAGPTRGDETVRFQTQVEFPGPVTLAGPDARADPPAKTRIPGMALGLALAAVGAVAVVVAFVRRK